MTKKNKPLYIVTHIIAFLCLLAGLLLPLNGDGMLVTQIPDAFKALINSTEYSFSGTLVYAFKSFKLDVGALFVLLYAVIAIVSLVVFILNAIFSKKGKALKVGAVTLEIISEIVLLFVLINELGYVTGTAETEITDILGILIAAGGTFVLLVIQTWADKKGSGALKCLMALLGIVTVIATLNLTFLSFYKEDFGSLGGLFAQTGSTHFAGAYTLKYLIEETLLGGGEYLFGSSAAAKIGSWCAAITVLLVIINTCIDLINMGSRTKKGVTIFDCVRYSLECLVTVAAVICLFAADNAEFGLLMFIVVAMSCIMAVVSGFRAGFFKKQTEEAEYEEETDTRDDAESEAAPADEDSVEMSPVVQEEESESYVTEDGVIRYKEREPYTGPEDSFISRLTEAEKKEFDKIFLQKIYGPYENMPDYVVDGDNKEFFDSVFVYLGKFRPIVSDGLMRKLYSEKNLLN